MLHAEVGIRRGSLQLRAAFEVPEGTVLGVFGPSGAGKTTLLGAIAGFIDLDDGEIRVDGVTLSTPGHTVPLERRGVGLVRQRPALFGHLSVRGNVGFAPRSTEQEVAALLERFGLTELAHRRPRELSGGEAQRVAIARALAAHPRVLLFDEPMTGLDHGLVDEVARAIREAARTCCVVLVEHDFALLARLADSILVLDRGRQLQLASSALLQRAPSSERVASLLGMVGPLVRGRSRWWCWPEKIRFACASSQGPNAEGVIVGEPRFVRGRFEHRVVVGEVGTLSLAAQSPWPPGPVRLELEDPVAIEEGCEEIAGTHERSEAAQSTEVGA